MKKYLQSSLCIGYLLLSGLQPVIAQVIPGYNERIEQQELEIRRLTGEVETLKYKNQNLEVKLNGLRKEMEFRFKDLQDQNSSINSKGSSNSQMEKEKKNELNSASRVLSPAQEKDSGAATVLYDAARADMQRKHYTLAANGFQKIIKDYPRHPLTANAYYWLGETHYAQKQYDKAALTFLEGKQKFPNSSKAGHSLLKLGLSLGYLKQKQDACLTFNEVEKHYITRDKSLIPTLESSRKKVGC